MNWLKRIFGSDAPRASSAPGVAAAAALPAFPFPLVAAPGGSAKSEWERLQAAWRREGASAILLGDVNDVAHLAEGLRGNAASPETLLARAGRQSAAAYFARRQRERAASGTFPGEDDWPEQPALPIELSAHLEVLSRQPKPAVYLARIPTTRAWEIPAYLKFGGWNDCPVPEDHVTVLQDWSARHGVEIFAICGDVMECTIARPPADREDARVLAREQFMYCPDIVYQGTESIGMLAASLVNSRAWYFWWG